MSWTRADLLDRFYLHAGRGNGGVMSADELFTTARTLRLLADAQEAVYTELAPIVPHALVSAPFQMTTTDGGVTYTYGSATPLAQIEVYAQESGGRELFAADYGHLSGDFVLDAQGIRMPGNRVRTFASGPWARGVFTPPRISETQEPTLQPLAARELILWRALELAADLPGGEIDPRPWRERYSDAFDRWVATWQRQVRTHGAQARPGLRQIGTWWKSLDQFNGGT